MFGRRADGNRLGGWWVLVIEDGGYPVERTLGSKQETVVAGG